jgi:hypothetical protein
VGHNPKKRHPYPGIGGEISRAIFYNDAVP